MRPAEFPSSFLNHPASTAIVRRLELAASDLAGISALELMEVAGSAVALVLQSILARSRIRGPVVVVAGRGNNGGDALVVARYLAASDHEVHVFMLEGSRGLPTGLVKTNLDRLAAFEVPVRFADAAGLRRELDSASVIVDGLIGIGLGGPVREPVLGALGAINASRKAVLALDIPSGLCSDTGQVMGMAARASWTITFGVVKRGLLFGEGPRYAGDIHLVPLPFPSQARRDAAANSPPV